MAASASRRNTRRQWRLFAQRFAAANSANSQFDRREALHVWASYVPINFVEVADDGLPYGTSTQYGTMPLPTHFH